MRFELSSAVCNYGGRYTKSRDPTTDECLCYNFCGDGIERNGFGPSSKSIDAGEEVCEAVGWREWSNQVDVDDIETGVRCWKCC